MKKEIIIKIALPGRELNQRQSQTIRRIAQVLRENGLDTEIVYPKLEVIKKVS